MRQDIAAHNDQTAKKSYLGCAVSALADFGLTAADKPSQPTEQLVSQYAAGMIKTVGLFIPGKAGYAISGVAYALDQAKPGDSISDQLIDGGLGLTKGLALKGSFDYVGTKDMGIALKAVSLGVSSRVLDSALTRQTYADGNGYSAAAGLSKTFEQSFNRTALASDVITFGIAHGALSGINSITSGALRNSPFWSTVATGGVFGASSGSVQEINRQQQAGEKFDFQKILTSAALTGATDMIAAGPGARMASVRASAVERDAKTDQSSEQIETAKISPILKRNFPDSHSREFQLVNSDQQVIDQLRSNPKQSVLAQVQEVTASGALGPPGNMLIQHLEPYKGSTSTLAVSRAAFGRADWLATCNPESLPEAFRSKHILPTAEGVYVTQDTTGRLRFTDTTPSELKPGESQPVKLDHTISELLLSPKTPKHIENTHDKTAIARAMQHFKTPVRYFNAGVDNISFELPDRSILKITDHGWDPSWGSRTVRTPNGIRPFDAPMLEKPHTIELRDSAVTYFVQKRMQTPVSRAQVREFDSLMKEDGVYEFWDNDFKTHGAHQLGIDPDNGKVYLVDYDAVRFPHLVPKFVPETQEELIDRVLERYND